MIDKNLARETVTLLGTAAAMLIEDVHDQLLIRPVDIEDVYALRSALVRTAFDLAALAGAAFLLTSRVV